MSKESSQPFKPLGDRIKFLREQWQQTIREVSATLEIDEKALRAIEDGNLLPENELLEMLISHFLLTDDQADDIRDLADEVKGKDNSSSGAPFSIEEILSKQVIMYAPIDNRIIYTDGMHANVNDHGVILQFMQQVPNQKQPITVSRVGMSRDHAERIIHVLQQTLSQYDANKSPKLLSDQNNPAEDQNQEPKT